MTMEVKDDFHLCIECNGNQYYRTNRARIDVAIVTPQKRFKNLLSQSFNILSKLKTASVSRRRRADPRGEYKMAYCVRMAAIVRDAPVVTNNGRITDWFSRVFSHIDPRPRSNSLISVAMLHVYSR
jgi:hypothetical protein